MADDENPSGSGIPEWQRGGDDNATAAAAAAGRAEEDQLAVARRFLEDEEVKSATREKKVAFLKAKGIEDDDIEKLLGEAEPSQSASATPAEASPDTISSETSDSTSTSSSNSSLLPSSDRAPIVTYPEFLANQQSNAQPPLVTTSGILSTLQVASVLSTLVIGSSKFILSPMLDRLTEFRVEYHDHTAAKLDALTTLLESTVSEIPSKNAAKNGLNREGDGDDSSSDADDPSEMFHRDIGTQTVQPVAVPSLSQAPKPAPAEAQATRVEGLTKKLGEIKDGLRNQSDDLGDIKTLVDLFRDDLDALTYKSPSDVAGLDMAGVYGRGASGGRKTEAEDEMKKARDNIRRIKGVLLSTRSFPATMR